MRERVYEIKDSDGKVVETYKKGWWNSSIVLSNLAPSKTVGLSGMVSARGGWCREGDWQNPEKPGVLQCPVSEWVGRLSTKLGVPGELIIDSISSILEELEDAKNTPNVIPPQPPDEEVV